MVPRFILQHNYVQFSILIQFYIKSIDHKFLDMAHRPAGIGRHVQYGKDN